MQVTNRKQRGRFARLLAGASIALMSVALLQPVAPVAAPAHADGAERSGARVAPSPQLSLDSLRARLAAAGEDEVKGFYRRCSEEVLARRLDGGEAMACSVVYDVLLKNHFGGDFAQLLAWSQSQRASAR